jgi:hypothetical protein
MLRIDQDALCQFRSYGNKHPTFCALDLGAADGAAATAPRGLTTTGHFTGNGVNVLCKIGTLAFESRPNGWQGLPLDRFRARCAAGEQSGRNWCGCLEYSCNDTLRPPLTPPPALPVMSSSACACSDPPTPYPARLLKALISTASIAGSSRHASINCSGPRVRRRVETYGCLASFCVWFSCGT